MILLFFGPTLMIANIISFIHDFSCISFISTQRWYRINVQENVVCFIFGQRQTKAYNFAQEKKKDNCWFPSYDLTRPQANKLLLLGKAHLAKISLVILSLKTSAIVSLLILWLNWNHREDLIIKWSEVTVLVIMAKSCCKNSAACLIRPTLN